jgi:hypothetical protein
MSEHKKKKRSLSKADRDPKIVAIKALRDSIADKEAAGAACKGLFACYKSGDHTACLKKIHDDLTALKAKEDGGSAKKTKGASGGKARSRSRSKSVVDLVAVPQSSRTKRS